MKRILPVFVFCFLFMTNIEAQDIRINSDDPGVTIQTGTKKKKGYYNTTQISLLMGTTQVAHSNRIYYDYYGVARIAYPQSYETTTEMQISPSVTMTNGYMFNEHWAMGLGVGIEIFDFNQFPVFADIRYTLSDKKVAPFFALKTGYAFGNFRAKHHHEISFNYPPYYATDASVRHYGGFMMNPEMGISISLSDHADLLFTVAYRYQKTKTRVTTETSYDDYYNADQWDNKAGLDRLSFGVAIMFR